ncbi:Rieske 2Fe-2S domain-containing protein [Parvularcula sp. ZS-1/3]|uniref:Rieske 2Fe-2S domain-containing protein n=1 Tax=Parvularcula mediterranea TaxID=2732508 RepID=A0A7Y3RN20_9PROT|nr:ferric reductase-like transmembrane domain-containing protein [Parvularcula mediterranea]NNU17020.1 Rieske 2Fe-2S domain-containing protein [Parvularcula mediterranea]
MAHDYKAIQWTPFKKRYDLFLLLGVATYLVLFFVFTAGGQPDGESLHPVQIAIAATGSLSFLMLTFILSIGPLARFTDRMKPFLYNRRHVGVATFIIALLHAALVVIWYHGFSETNVFVSLLASNPRYSSLQGFPFESLGVAAFFILFLMAATSHDFWNAHLGPGLWKALHMLVYVAFALLVGHVMFGFVQDQTSIVYPVLVGSSALWVSGLHIAAGFKSATPSDVHLGRFIEVAEVSAFEEGRARIVTPSKGERIAVFLHKGKLSAISNVCRHQGGPLGEGRVIDDCVTCPWHGFQYRLEDGRSPEPFSEKVATYSVKVEDGMVFVDSEPKEPGTRTEPVSLHGEDAL